jgi:hypothetical protein
MSYTKESRFTMPDGELFRTRSARRYVVAVKGPSAEAKWQASYRTDVESRAVAQWRHEARICEAAALVDTTTGEVIR